jgi:hypothetical protein
MNSSKRTKTVEKIKHFDKALKPKKQPASSGRVSEQLSSLLDEEKRKMAAKQTER